MHTIEQTVGRGGVNRPADVRTIQTLLVRSGVRVMPTGSTFPLLPVARPILAVDGVCGRDTIDHILEYQQSVVGIRVPSGWIGPDTQTLFHLNGMSGGVQEMTPRTPPPRSRSFRLCVLGDVSGGQYRPRAQLSRLAGGPAFEGMILQIEDTENRWKALYEYTGGGLGVGLRFTPNVSLTAAGDWNHFTTSAPMDVGDFNGVARFTTAGGGPWTVNWLHLLGTPRGVDPVYMMVETGFTFGGGATTTVGYLGRMSGPSPIR